MIEPGGHLWRCMVYIELNMVRAGAVKHPGQWLWCSYGEWIGLRQRSRVVDLAECLRRLGGASLEEFRANYQSMIQEALARDMAREAHWTEGIAVGSRAFVESIAQTITCRQRLECSMISESGWVLREQESSAVRSLD